MCFICFCQLQILFYIYPYIICIILCIYAVSICQTCSVPFHPRPAVRSMPVPSTARQQGLLDPSISKLHNDGQVPKMLKKCTVLWFIYCKNFGLNFFTEKNHGKKREKNRCEFSQMCKPLRPLNPCVNPEVYGTSEAIEPWRAKIRN